MRFMDIPRFIVIALIAGAAALALSLSMGVVSASSAQNGQLHLVKECSQPRAFPVASARSPPRTSSRSPSARRSSMPRRLFPWGFPPCFPIWLSGQ